MAVSAGGADDGRVAEAARLIVRAERVASVRFYVTSHARLLPLIARPETLDQLVAPAEEELTPLSPRRTASARRAASAAAAAADAAAAATRGGGGSAALGAPLAFSDPTTLPVGARRKAERASAALLAGQWDAAAEMLDDARDVAKGEPAAAAAASALDVMYALALASDPARACKCSPRRPVPHRYALALASDPASRDKAEAWAVVHEYCRKVAELHVACEPLLLLALARLDYGGVALPAPSARSRPRSSNSYACLALFAQQSAVSHVPGAVLGALGLQGSALITDAERREIAEVDAARSRELIAGALLQEASTESVNPSRVSSTSLGPEARWQRAHDDALVEGDPVLPSSALDELMMLRGLQHVKNIALELHTRVMAERKLPPEMRVKTSLNFSLMGNPGTGKTTVAKLLGKLLHELGLRSSTTFVSTSGEAMARECPKKIPGLIASADNGVLFIDEAYQLDPAKNSEGKAVVNQLLTAAEEQRETMTIIFAGYKDDIEEKLYGFNPGLKSRFRDILFEDFTQPELREIFLELARKNGWPLDANVAEVASRRVARRRGVKGFANARDVRTLFEQVKTCL